MDGEEVVLDGGAAVADADQGAGDEEIQGTPVAGDGEGDAGAEAGGDEAGKGGDNADGDGRKITGKLRAHIAEIGKTDPELAKEIKRLFYGFDSYSKLGRTTELQSLKEAVETYGGVEQLGAMAEEVEAGRMLEQGFQRGDPKVIDGWAKDYPEGFAKLVGPAFDKLAQINPQRYEREASAVTTKFLNNYGVFAAFEQMGEALRGGKPEDVAQAAKLYNEMVTKVFAPMRQMAQASNEDPYKDRAAELDAREQQIAEEGKTAFYSSVRSDVNTQVTRAINAALVSMTKGRKFEGGQGNRIRSQINADLTAAVNGETGYAKQYEAVMNSRDRDKAIRFIVGKATAKLPIVVRTVLKDFRILGGVQAKPGAGKPAVGGKPSNEVRGSGAPKTSEVDFSRTEMADFLIMRQQGKGQAYLKNGKLMKWG
jgi:hypothetical protein